MDAKVPSWGNLLVKLIKHKWQCNEDEAKMRFNVLLNENNSSFLIVARIILKDIPPKEQIRVMHAALYENTEESNLINTLCQTIKSREVDSVITFNYDVLLEEGLERIKLKTTSISEKNIQIKDHVPIYHVHGIIPRVLKLDEQSHSLSYITPVLTEHDYHELYGDIYSWSNILTLNTLNHNTCVLMGLSMTDPNLRRLLDISYKNKGEDKFHYVFLGHEGNNLKENDHIRGELLEELGLKVIWYRVKNKGKDHSELIKLLKALQ